MAKNKRYTLKTKKNGQVKNCGYIDMKNSAGAAELYLYGDIVDDELTATYFGGSCPQEIADFVAGLSPNQPLTIYFNSPGGDVFAGLAIYNVLKRHQGRKTGQVDGMAASIASVILMACDDRVVNTGAQVMIHDPWTYAAGNAGQLRDMADQLDQAAESILDVYMTATVEGVARDTIAGLMHAETWMRGEAAAEWFDLRTADAPAVAAAASDLIKNYANLPEALRRAEQEKTTNEKRAEALLNDLCLYGTK